MAVRQTGILCLLFFAGPLLSVSALDSCLAYTDSSGRNHASRNCSTGGESCCGSCTSRYCCRDFVQSISQFQQNLCNSRDQTLTRFRRGGLISGMVSSTFLIIMIILCCLCRPGCPIYQMRMDRRASDTVVVIHTQGNEPTPYQGPPLHASPYPGAPPAEVYPPPGEKFYSQPAFAPGQPAYPSPAPAYPPQPGYNEPPPPYPTS